MTGRRAGAAIVGLGITEMGKIYGRSAVDFGAEALALALEDAGLQKSDVDGLLVNQNLNPDASNPMVQINYGFEDLSLYNVMYIGGATAGTMLQYATLAIEAGLATTVAMVFADAPLVQNVTAGDAYNITGRPAGLAGLQATYGIYGQTSPYAQAAQRHMSLYGTTSEQLGAIAVAQRAWAGMNPQAQKREPITIEDHQTSRMICEPLHLLDCCLVSNGAVAVIVTSAERAADLRQAPVHVRAVTQSAPGDNDRAGRDPLITTGAKPAGEAALARAGVTRDDVGMLQLYDCFTYTVLVTIEDYGFCPKGEGGPFVEDGKLGPGGSLPTNTGGGQLSAFYMWGFTPLAEGIVQARGAAGERQVPDHDVVMVSGNGGNLHFHATTILSTQPA